MAFSQKNELDKQLNTYWNRLESMFTSKGMRGDNLREFGDKLRAASVEDRPEVIKTNYGQLYLDRVRPLLYQIAALENEIKKLATIAEK